MDGASRWSQHLDVAGEPPALPPATEGSLLWLAFLEIGFASQGPGGPSVLTWAEIQAYSSTILTLTATEASALRTMSAAYLAAHHIGGNPLARPPWSGPPIYGPDKRPRK